eukprot:8995094-Alexandrium_andersonii.AAC.1
MFDTATVAYHPSQTRHNLGANSSSTTCNAQDSQPPRCRRSTPRPTVHPRATATLSATSLEDARRRAEGQGAPSA